MRKMLIAFLVLISLLLLSTYLFFPAKISFRKSILVRVNQTNANRFIFDENKWYNWWPNQLQKNDPSDTITAGNHFYNNYYYSVNYKLLIGDSITIKNNTMQLKSLLYTISLNSDSISLNWIGESANMTNPIDRVRNYLNRSKVEKNADDLLRSIKNFLENKENLYGLRIDQIQVKDTMLITTKYVSKDYPGTNEVYTLINKLRQYISKQGAIETNNPMLNVMKDSAGFKTMVAIPINKEIPESINLSFKRMVPGKILVTEVIGGNTKVNNALKTINLYMIDYHLISPAIPFQSLETDRSKEGDTTKWRTKIYYPVM